ncbi:MAG: LysR family transcriptional regulator, partial [Sneathiella sp.]
MKKLPLPSLNALRVFEAAGRLGSFSVAAEELLVTQSAVSRQIILLEDELGCSLFSRSRSGVTLSTYGREYHARVSRSLLEVSDATEAIKLKRAGLNILRVTTLPTLASHWLIPRLLDFKKRHPGIAVDVSCSNMLEDLTTNAFQVGIRLGT